MHPISEEDIQRRITRDNPWWDASGYQIPEASSPKRVYFSSFKSLALNKEVKRATVLLGPRRVGKTFMIKQLIDEALKEGVDHKRILYVSIDTPVYSGMPIEKFLSYMPKGDPDSIGLVIFDEIQYLKHWEVHLKDLVDNYPGIKFVASGSAAAALKLKSIESGAGRFSDFMLPPLTFYEFLMFLNEGEKHIRKIPAKQGMNQYEILNIDDLNSRFIDYLNYGGYPEVVLNAEIQKNPEQFIKNDIIDKVLLKDLPNLYGISGIQELNRLFSFLAYNAGTEASYENICQESGINKPTIRRYIDYLESAFLIIKLSTVDDNCKSLKRERNFKIYLNNPSLRAALFAPVSKEDSTQVGHLAESAVFSQWQHSRTFMNLKYARWKNGEVDIAYLTGANQKPFWIGEIKWSDRIATHREEETAAIKALLQKHLTIKDAFITTKTVRAEWTIENRHIDLVPTSAYCYLVGRNITSSLEITPLRNLGVTTVKAPNQSLN